jgi:methyl-accepting chemotaxis protein
MILKQMVSVALVLFLVVMSSAVFAQDDKATKEECVAKVNEAVKQIKAEGFEAVKPRIQKAGGPFTWKSDGYVFCMDTKEGIFLAHPLLPSFILGRSMLGRTDSNGKAFVKELMDKANNEGEGWVDYMVQRPDVPVPVLKETYVMKVPEADVIVGAGYFPVKEQ